MVQFGRAHPECVGLEPSESQGCVNFSLPSSWRIHHLRQDGLDRDISEVGGVSKVSTFTGLVIITSFVFVDLFWAKEPISKVSKVDLTSCVSVGAPR